MFPFNFITSEPADELLPLCQEHDVGFIDMKPMAGGMLEDPTIAFKYLFQFPDMVIIPGIQKVHEIEEIVRIYEGPHEMTPVEQAEMQRMTKELGTRFCRRCDYCQPCSQEIPISMVMSFPAFINRLPDDWFTTGWGPGLMEKAADCSQCGECEPRCPYNLPIIDMIAENYKRFQEVRAQLQK